MSVFTLKHGSLTMQDATGVPITVSLGPGPGNFSCSDLEQGMVEAIPVYNRGTFLELVEGQQKAVEFAIELIQNAALILGGSGTPLNAVLKAGTFAAGTTVDPGGLVWTLSGVFTCVRNAVSSTITITNARCKVSYSEDAGGNKLAISGTAYGTGSVLPIVVA